MPHYQEVMEFVPDLFVSILLVSGSRAVPSDKACDAVRCLHFMARPGLDPLSEGCS